MVEISGIPRMDDEKPVELITKMAQIAKFQNFDDSTIDVAHRISTKDDATIIVLFTNRSAREEFYSQKRKLSAINVNQIMCKEEEGKYPDPEEQRDPSTFVFLNESLTPENKKLLGETRRRAKEAGYKHTYTHKGRIHVRKTDRSKDIHIRCREDIDQIA